MVCWRSCSAFVVGCAERHRIWLRLVRDPNSCLDGHGIAPRRYAGFHLFNAAIGPGRPRTAPGYSLAPSGRSDRDPTGLRPFGFGLHESGSSAWGGQDTSGIGCGSCDGDYDATGFRPSALAAAFLGMECTGVFHQRAHGGVQWHGGAAAGSLGDGPRLVPPKDPGFSFRCICRFDTGSNWASTAFIRPSDMDFFRPWHCGVSPSLAGIPDWDADRKSAFPSNPHTASRGRPAPHQLFRDSAVGHRINPTTRNLRRPR